jgi:hypothetical protein
MLHNLFRIMAASILALILQTANSRAEATPSTFKLRAVQSHEVYGPFPFKTNARIKVESGIFSLHVISSHTFRLQDTGDKTIYGVYELVPGRMIDIGNVLFSITDIVTPPPANSSTASALALTNRGPGFFDDTCISLEVDLQNTINFNWKLDGEAGDSEEKMERRSACLRFRKGYLTTRVGLITSSEWDNTIEGDGETYENATLEEGRGWFVGLGIRVPIFHDGRWSAHGYGEASFHQESLSLTYGSWEVGSITTTTITNGATNVVTTTTDLDYVNHDEDATLTETLVMLGAEITYDAPAWFIYAGLKALPWEDTSLDATIEADDKKLDIEFERKDPVMVYGGLGLNVGGIKCFVEGEGGGEVAVRLGLSKEM